MTNRQAQIGKFAPNRSEQPKYNPNWWHDLPKTHPLHDPMLTRQQGRSQRRAAVKHMISSTKATDLAQRDPNSPNRHERRKLASIQRKAKKVTK